MFAWSPFGCLIEMWRGCRWCKSEGPSILRKSVFDLSDGYLSVRIAEGYDNIIVLLVCFRQSDPVITLLHLSISLACRTNFSRCGAAEMMEPGSSHNTNTITIVRVSSHDENAGKPGREALVQDSIRYPLLRLGCRTIVLQRASRRIRGSHAS